MNGVENVSELAHILRLRTHFDRFDEVLGVHHHVEPFFHKPGLIRASPGVW